MMNSVAAVTQAITGNSRPASKRSLQNLAAASLAPGKDFRARIR